MQKLSRRIQKSKFPYLIEYFQDGLVLCCELFCYERIIIRNYGIYFYLYHLSFSIPISCTFFVLILPIVPMPRLSLFSVIDFLFVTVAVLLVFFPLLLLPLLSLDHVLIFQLPNFFKGHCGFIRILLPYLSDQIFSAFSGTHTMMDLLFWRNFPDFNLWDWLE